MLACGSTVVCLTWNPGSMTCRHIFCWVFEMFAVGSFSKEEYCMDDKVSKFEG